MIRLPSSLLLTLLFAAAARAGDGYEVTSMQDGKPVTYMVIFGGGFLFEQHTAFDPVSKQFVYLSWPRDGKAPEPVGQIWDHRTGETIALYQFPGVKHPLPIIPSMEAMKVCPVTGDKDFQARLVLAVD